MSFVIICARAVSPDAKPRTTPRFYILRVSDAQTVPFLHFQRPDVASVDPVGRSDELRRWHATWSSPDTAHCQRRLARV